MPWLARAGLAARGVIYVLIGALAVQIAFGSSPHEADRAGALRLVGGFPLSQFEARTGLPRATIDQRLDDALQRGWIRRSADWVTPTEFGRRFTNDVISLFLAD